MVILHCSKFSYLHWRSLLYIFEVVSLGFDVVFSVLVKRLAGKGISELMWPRLYVHVCGWCRGDCGVEAAEDGEGERRISDHVTA